MTGTPTHEPLADEPWNDESEDEGRGTLLEVVLTIVAALVLAFLVQEFLVKPFKIPSGSMENTLRCGDRVLVDRISYRLGDPDRGDIVVFNPPAGIGEGGLPDPSVVADQTIGNAARTAEDNTRTDTAADTNYIKRIIGLPGDRVEVVDHRAIVNGDKLDEPYVRPIPDVEALDGDSRADWGPRTVPRDAYLMLGDHRDNSADGRVFGFVPEEFIVGKAFMVYWPPKRFGGLPDKDPGGAAATQADPNCLEGGVPSGQTLDEDG